MSGSGCRSGSRRCVFISKLFLIFTISKILVNVIPETIKTAHSHQSLSLYKCCTVIKLNFYFYVCSTVTFDDTLLYITFSSIPFSSLHFPPSPTDCWMFSFHFYLTITIMLMIFHIELVLENVWIRTILFRFFFFSFQFSLNRMNAISRLSVEWISHSVLFNQSVCLHRRKQYTLVLLFCIVLSVHECRWFLVKMPNKFLLNTLSTD